MYPYRRLKKSIRRRQIYGFGWLGGAGKAIGSLLKDLQIVWSQDPPFPPSVRILISLMLIWAIIMPFLYILVPPALTTFTIYLLYSQEVPAMPAMPAMPPLAAVQKWNIVLTIKELFKKGMYRLSMLVTLYDYVQTFRALGGFNLQR